MNRDEAIKLAQTCAKRKPESYYSEPFMPHEWVIEAIMIAAQGKINMNDEGRSFKEYKKLLEGALDAIPDYMDGRHDRLVGKIERVLGIKPV